MSTARFLSEAAADDGSDVGPDIPHHAAMHASSPDATHPAKWARSSHMFPQDDVAPSLLFIQFN
jgi:hypothetical protein